MKIVLTAHQFLPDYSAGTEIIVYNIAKELQNRGHDVTVITGFPFKTPMPDQYRFDSYVYDGLRVQRFNHAFLPMGGQENILEMEYNNRFFYRWFKEYLRKHRPDVVHFIHLGRLSGSAVEACVELGIPTVFTATDFWFICPTNQLRLPDGAMCGGPDCHSTNCLRHVAQVSQTPDKQWHLEKYPDVVLAFMAFFVNQGLFPDNPDAAFVTGLTARPDYLRRRINQIDRVLAPSHLMGKMLIAYGLRPSHVTYLPYGISVAHIPRRTDKGLYPKLRVGFVGTIFEHKGPQVLVKAIKSLPADVPIELKLHGKTTEFPDFVAQLRELIADDPRITLAGPFVNHQVGGILAEMDVLVCPSIWYENTPLVIYEAMAAGCPVIASDYSGMRESIDERVNGLLFEPGNHEQLAQHLAKLARDRGYLRQLAEKTKMPLSVPDHVTELETVYGELMAAKTAQPVAY